MTHTVAQIAIREAAPADAGKLAWLLEVLGYTLDAAAVMGRLDDYQAPRGRVFVAETAGTVAGFLSFQILPLFHESSGLGRITAMAIDPERHRRGIGRALVAVAEAFGLTHGCTRIEVTSGDHREQDAHLFYKSLGYASDCRRFLKRLTN